MKRYQWFAYSQYYPYGGSNDIAGEAATLKELVAIMAASDKLHKESVEVLDLKERRWLDYQQGEQLISQARALKAAQ